MSTSPPATSADQTIWLTRLSDVEESSPSDFQNGPGNQPNEKLPDISTRSLSSSKPEETQAQFIADWTLKILGFLGVIAFGIWAPISYKATLQGNQGNDATQSMILQALPAVASSASVASTTAFDPSLSSALHAQVTALSSLQSYQLQLERLQLLEFCLARTNYLPCVSFSSMVDATSLIIDIAGFPLTVGNGATSSSTGGFAGIGTGIEPTSPASTTSIETGGGTSGAGALPLSTGVKHLSAGAFAAITVIVVLLIVAASVGAGFLAWKKKRARRHSKSVEI